MRVKIDKLIPFCPKPKAISINSENGMHPILRGIHASIKVCPETIHSVRIYLCKKNKGYPIKEVSWKYWEFNHYLRLIMQMQIMSLMII
jgi:hypothetical protein